MKLNLHIDRLVVRGFEEAQVRAALARLPRHLQEMAAKAVAGGRLPDLRLKVASADPEALARSIAEALKQALADAARTAVPAADKRRWPRATEYLHPHKE